MEIKPIEKAEILPSGRRGGSPRSFPAGFAKAWPLFSGNQPFVEKTLHQFYRHLLPFPAKACHNGPGSAGRQPPVISAGFSLLRVSPRPGIIEIALKIEYKSQFEIRILQMG